MVQIIKPLSAFTLAGGELAQAEKAKADAIMANLNVGEGIGKALTAGSRWARKKKLEGQEDAAYDREMVDQSAGDENAASQFNQMVEGLPMYETQGPVETQIPGQETMQSPAQGVQTDEQLMTQAEQPDSPRTVIKKAVYVSNQLDQEIARQKQMVDNKEIEPRHAAANIQGFQATQAKVKEAARKASLEERSMVNDETNTASTAQNADSTRMNSITSQGTLGLNKSKFGHQVGQDAITNDFNNRKLAEITRNNTLDANSAITKAEADKAAAQMIANGQQVLDVDSTTLKYMGAQEKAAKNAATTLPMITDVLESKEYQTASASAGGRAVSGIQGLIGVGDKHKADQQLNLLAQRIAANSPYDPGSQSDKEFQARMDRALNMKGNSELKYQMIKNAEDELKTTITQWNGLIESPVSVRYQAMKMSPVEIKASHNPDNFGAPKAPIFDGTAQKLYIPE